MSDKRHPLFNFKYIKFILQKLKNNHFPLPQSPSPDRNGNPCGLKWIFFLP
jgi:hypothetical protein